MKYRVSVEGSGFQLDGKAGSFGFFTHCFVVADSAELAGEKAIARVSSCEGQCIGDCRQRTLDADPRRRGQRTGR